MLLRHSRFRASCSRIACYAEGRILDWFQGAGKARRLRGRGHGRSGQAPTFLTVSRDHYSIAALIVDLPPSAWERVVDWFDDL